MIPTKKNTKLKFETGVLFIVITNAKCSGVSARRLPRAKIGGLLILLVQKTYSPRLYCILFHISYLIVLCSTSHPSHVVPSHINSPLATALIPERKKYPARMHPCFSRLGFSLFLLCGIRRHRENGTKGARNVAQSG